MCDESAVQKYERFTYSSRTVNALVMPMLKKLARSREGDLFARRTEKMQTGNEIALGTEPKGPSTPGTSLPKTEINIVRNGKFAEYVGQFKTQDGIISFTEEDEALIGYKGGGPH